jgi:hypothetical protein
LPWPSAGSEGLHASTTARPIALATATARVLRILIVRVIVYD